MSDTQSTSVGAQERSRDPSAEDVRAQLERILASPDFAQSERQKRFLRYIVEETLAERAARLSEYAIGVDVFDRGESFDPQTSSIVRVEASRLRGKLEKYNATGGQHAPCRIVLPRGGYVPIFELTELDAKPPTSLAGLTPQPEARRTGLPGRAIWIAVAALAASLGAFLFSEISPFGSSLEQPQEELEPHGGYSLAVLPLRNLSGDPEQDYFSDGVTDALTTNLAKVDGLRVISMTSAMAYKNVDRAVADIARELGVNHVVEGSVLRVNDRVRITAQLIEAESDRHIWAESYERDISNVLALQDEVVRHIASSLSQRIGPAAEGGSPDAPTVDPAAYEAYLKGNFFRNKMTEDGFRRGLDYFRQAIETAPDYAPAYSGLATCYCLLGGHGFEIIRPHEAIPTAREAVLEALQLDDTLPEAHAFLGIIRLKYEWDWPGAEEAFLRAIALNPNYAQARIFHSYYLEAMGQQEAAIAEARRARTIDPLSLAANVNLGWQLLKADRLDEGKQIFEATAELDPDFWGVHWGLGQYHRMNGETEAAILEFERAIAAGGGHAMPFAGLGYTYAVAGQVAKAHEMLDKLAALSERGYVSPFNVAIIHAGMGNKEEAFSFLEQAYADRSRSMAWLNVTEELSGLRSDPRFDSLLHRVGLVQ